MSTPQLVADLRCDVGEGPLWHPEERRLYFLDIPACAIYCYDPQTSACRLFSQGAQTGGMTLQEDGRILLFQDGRISALDSQGGQRELAAGLHPGNDRFNDVIADPEGRVFAGVMGGAGRLFRFEPDGAGVELFDAIAVPNGMGFSSDLRHFYFTDTTARTIYRFAYNRSDGALSNRQVFVQIPEAEGFPDGMTVDAEGFVWTAIWFGAKVKRFAPDGTLDREVHFPVAQISSVAFGGDQLTDLYATTAAGSGADRLKPPGYTPDPGRRGGGLYVCRIEGVRGRPESRSRLQFKKSASL